MHKCPYCSYEHENLNSLRIHNQRIHKGNALDLRIALFHASVRPTCKCKCGGETRFLGIEKGFSDFCPGHQARVNNNWGHNKVALDKSHATNKARLASGENVIWNKGLTKETSRNVASYGKKGSETILANPEELSKRSEMMSEHWKNGKIVALSGPESSQWKGGVSSVQGLARSHVFNVWTFPKLKEAKFTCQHCGTHDNLCVHHDGERFATILQKARTELGDVDSFEKTYQYAKWVADYHVKNNVSGVVLCHECHHLEHEKAGEFWLSDDVNTGD
jgi:S-adenosylmethionine/arginine decarboxylase-like enzyme